MEVIYFIKKIWKLYISSKKYGSYIYKINKKI